MWSRVGAGIAARILRLELVRSRARLAQQFRKVALAHERGGNREVVRRDREDLAQRLVVAEAKELVPDDRPADGETGLVPEESRGRSGRRSVEVVVRVGVEAAVAVKLEGRAVVLVGAALRRADHDGAAGASVLGRGDVRVDFEFLRGVDVGIEQNRVHEAFVVIHAVQDVIIRLRTKAVDSESRRAALVVAHGLSRVGAAAARGDVAIRAAGDAWRQEGQLGEVAAVQRQVRHLLALNGLPDRGVRRVYQRRRVRYGHGGAYRSRHQLEDQRLGRCHLDGEVHDLALEPARPDLGAVRAARHGGYLESPCAVGRRLKLQPRGQVADVDGRIRNGCACLIGHGADDAAVVGLGVRTKGGKDRKYG